MANTTENPSTLLHKIIIPVITTVLGATAIYFLGFNKKNGTSEAEKEKATVSAWQTFVSSQNISYKNLASLTSEYEDKFANELKNGGVAGLGPILRDFKGEIFSISGKGREDVEIILKNDNIDEAFVTMMNRVLANSKDEEKKADDFFDSLISLTKSNLSEDEKKTRFVQEAEKYTEIGKKSDERAANEAEEIALTLSKKYNRPFDLNELKVYVDYKKEKDKKNPDENIIKPDKDEPVKGGPAPADPNKGGIEIKENQNPLNDDKPVSDNYTNNQTEPTKSMLTGQWSMTGGILELSANGTMFWTFDSKGYTSGKWQLIEGKLQMNATNPDTGKKSLLIGFLSNVANNSFTMTFHSTPEEVYNFTRKK